ncbi:hotdog domain-containing protein [Actinomadura sp. WAC 06369]|uniref:hotdog domain-containing protein n=1 Tax=Actinomadura sp. WAC 06369 TaxID=2203193 RepID=UPI000F7893DB|nr:hotdog domain-containing protein [Actinomadura sp. WAC 06369]RSN66797.1 thioesterase [Actinomadura sp. WAC 06369]
MGRAEAAWEGRSRILTEFGLAVRSHGGELHGTGAVTPHLHAPGTARLRTSVLAAWTDHLTGLLAARTMAPRVPVTIELDVHLYGPAPAAGEVRGVARVVKAGRSVFVAEAEFAAGGAPLGFGAASFMAAPDPAVRLPERLGVDAPAPAGRLEAPLAERAGCVRREPGTVVLPRSEEGLNSSNTVHGGLLALAAEEAVLSLAPGAAVESLALRYLAAARVGPVVATADLWRGLARAVLRDAGGGDRVAVAATARTSGGRRPPEMGVSTDVAGGSDRRW